MSVVAFSILGCKDHVAAVGTRNVLSYWRHDDDFTAIVGLANVPVHIV